MSKKCFLCPRNCGVDRSKAVGYCKCSDKPKVARVGLHIWEEPCISLKKGSGTVFFSGCGMRCVYCQNYEISSCVKGKEIEVDELSEEILKLRNMGAENINFVTPTHFADKIMLSLDKVKPFLDIPVVYNSSGYEKVETLKMLEGYVDIYLPDFKYYSSAVSEKYSSCPDYYKVACGAVREMIRQTGKPLLDEDGKMLRGTLIRHMVLPSLYRDSIAVFDGLENEIEVEKAAVSVMNQYFPSFKASEYKEINRKTTTLEYNKVVERVRRMNFAFGYVQDRASSNSEYVPTFDYGDEKR